MSKKEFCIFIATCFIIFLICIGIYFVYSSIDEPTREECYSFWADNYCNSKQKVGIISNYMLRDINTTHPAFICLEFNERTRETSKSNHTYFTEREKETCER